MQTYTRTVDIETGKDYANIDGAEFYRTLGQRAREESALLEMIKCYFLHSNREIEESITIRERSFDFSLDISHLTSYQSERMNIALTTKITYFAPHYNPIPVYAFLESITAVFTAVCPNREQGRWKREVDRSVERFDERLKEFQKKQVNERYKPKDMGERVKLEREALIYHEGLDSSYFNNFYELLPGGDHRMGQWSQEHLDDLNTQGSDLLRSLTHREFNEIIDNSVAELGLDTTELRLLQEEEREIYSPYKSYWVKHNGERATEKEREEIHQRLKLNQEKLNNLILPLFIRLREKGFEYLDLIR